MEYSLASRESLVTRIVTANRKVVFLTGAALSQPDGDSPGVPGVEGMIETIREIIRINRLDEQFEDALDSRDGRSRYQRAMAFLSDNLGPQRVRSVVERSVQRARRVEDEKPPSRELEDDLEYWYLNTGTAALEVKS